MIQRLEAQVGAVLMAAHSQKIVFAIAVDELECWLLPLIQNLPGLLGAKNATKDRTRYAAVSRPFRKARALGAARERQFSLDVFVNDLTTKAAALRAPA